MAEDFVVSIFRKRESELPVDLVRGTPILFRRVKVSLKALRSHDFAESPGH